MPFPWKKKKNRVTRISQIVADLHSPKHGASLVVETGFPTSLIDLFVKNRTRFSKPRSNKPPPTDTPYPPPPPPSPATTPPLTTKPPPAMPAPVNEEKVIHDRVAECGSGPGAIFKVLMVAVMAVTVERLTVGITVSAFALLLLEYAGKRVVSSLRPIESSLLRRISSHLGFQKLRIQLNTNEDREPDATELLANSSIADEIEIVEENSEVVGNGIDCELEEEEEEKLGSDQCKVRGSRSGRFKSNMVKKLAHLKLRGSKKEKKEKQNEIESGSEVSSVVAEEERLQSFEIEEVVEGGSSKRLSFLLTTTEHDESVRNDDVDSGGNGITYSQESLIEEKRIESVVGNSGYTMLVIVTLVGLIVGRFPALILTMTWCLLLKIVKVLCR